MINNISAQKDKTSFTSIRLIGKYSNQQVKEAILPLVDFATKHHYLKYTPPKGEGKVFSHDEIHFDIKRAKFEDGSFYGQMCYYLDIHPLGKGNIFNKKPVWKVRIATDDFSEYSPDKSKTVFGKINNYLKSLAKVLAEKNGVSNNISNSELLRKIIPSKREEISGKPEIKIVKKAKIAPKTQEQKQIESESI